MVVALMRIVTTV
jgi:hypothetical protein